jgi:hypothetical protein
MWVRESASGVAIVRDCVRHGPQSGEFDPATGELIRQLPQGVFARDWMVQLVQLADEDTPRFRVTDVEYSDTEGCE